MGDRCVSLSFPGQEESRPCAMLHFAGRSRWHPPNRFSCGHSGSEKAPRAILNSYGDDCRLQVGEWLAAGARRRLQSRLPVVLLTVMWLTKMKGARHRKGTALREAGPQASCGPWGLQGRARCQTVGRICWLSSSRVALVLARREPASTGPVPTDGALTVPRQPVSWPVACAAPVALQGDCNKVADKKSPAIPEIRDRHGGRREAGVAANESMPRAVTGTVPRKMPGRRAVVEAAGQCRR